MDGSDAVAARFLRAVVTGVEGVLPGKMNGEWDKASYIHCSIDGVRFSVDISVVSSLTSHLTEHWATWRKMNNCRYRCTLELPFPLAANGFEPSAQRERRVSESGLQKVAAEFAGLIVAAVEASKRERGPRLVVDNTVGGEA